MTAVPPHPADARLHRMLGGVPPAEVITRVRGTVTIIWGPVQCRWPRDLKIRQRSALMLDAMNEVNPKSAL